jgi:hypothetical protein
MTWRISAPELPLVFAIYAARRRATQSDGDVDIDAWADENASAFLLAAYEYVSIRGMLLQGIEGTALGLTLSAKIGPEGMVLTREEES